MSISRIFFFLVLAVFLVACPTTTVATQVFDRSINQPEAAPIPVTGENIFSGCAGPIIPVMNADFEQAVVEQTNQVRMQNGLPPLKQEERLANSARYHAADMSFTNYFSHDTLGRRDDQLVDECDTWQRIENYYTDWLALAENIAAGQRTPEQAMDGWMNSPEHLHNILSDNFMEIGVGFYEGRGEYRFYWDQNFGKREGVYPLVIAGEKAQTNQQDVAVYIYGDFESMRLRNDAESWTPWQPFENNLTWTLPETAGPHTVSVELRGVKGKYQSSDTIVLAP